MSNGVITTQLLFIREQIVMKLVAKLTKFSQFFLGSHYIPVSFHHRVGLIFQNILKVRPYSGSARNISDPKRTD